MLILNKQQKIARGYLRSAKAFVNGRRRDESVIRGEVKYKDKIEEALSSPDRHADPRILYSKLQLAWPNRTLVQHIRSHRFSFSP